MPSDTDIAWAAGLFDGEGCIHITKDKRGPGYYSLRTTVSMVHLPTLEHVCLLFKGMIRPHGYRARRRQLWRWEISGYDAECALTQMLPYLRQKHDEAVLALAFRMSFQEKHSYRLTATVSATREEAFQRLKSLKRFEWTKEDGGARWCRQLEPAWLTEAREQGLIVDLGRASS